MSTTIDSLLNTPKPSIVGRKRPASCASEDTCPPSKKRMLYSPGHDNSFESLSTMADSDSESLKTESYTSNYELSVSPARSGSPYLWHWLPPLEEPDFYLPHSLAHYQPEDLSSCPTMQGVGLGLGPITEPTKKLGIYGDKPRRPISQPRKIPYPVSSFSSPLPSFSTPERRYPSYKLEYPSPSAISPSPRPISPQSSVLDLMARCLVYSFTSWEVPSRPIHRSPSPDPTLHLPPIDVPSLTL
ncbi:hypothetical protein FRC10_008043 [Ceratobasidium sp. 414]|nr:hypothetical protein FRC10_008043 [Ceratobasidium sp. 414]